MGDPVPAKPLFNAQPCRTFTPPGQLSALRVVQLYCGAPLTSCVMETGSSLYACSLTLRQRGSLNSFNLTCGEIPYLTLRFFTNVPQLP